MNAEAELSEQKKQLREQALARRDALPPELRAAAAEAIAARGLPMDVKPGTIVSGFMPIRSEINPLPLMKRLSEAGARLALPAIAGRGKPLSFREWKIGDALARGQWGIREPGPDAAEVTPDIILAPLAAFDRRGNRLGYGAGYYDMSIKAARANKPALAIGMAYAVQQFGEVPVTERDVRLDLVLTENELIDLRGA